MQWILKGIEKFQKEVFPRHRARFEALATRQSPKLLLITCADSRIDPNLVTQTHPGDLFLVRNAGNLVPPDAAAGSEAATIEYGIRVLGIRDVVVCGHTDCGAMKSLLQRGTLEELPAVRRWLETAAPALRVLERRGLAPDDPDALRAVTEENVLVQLDHLRAHPAVAAANVRLYGCMYEISTGTFLAHDPARGAFVPLPEAGLDREE
ncbi:MAG: carbonic anhydrase [Deltaproteobacteria bacterium]|nr:carbonic anhydrase [Deltaproteobacteria bacterium]